MDQHFASVFRRPRTVVPFRDESGRVDPECTVYLSEHDHLDMALQIELQRWEDDGGAIATDSRGSPALAVYAEHAHAA